MKKPSFLNKLVLVVGLLFASQVFAAESIAKWTDVAVEPPQSGGVYQISTPEQLAWISSQTNGKGSSYNVKLMNDIDLAGKLWLPICAGNHST